MRYGFSAVEAESRVRQIACAILFVLGVCSLLLLNTRFYDNAVTSLGLWTAAILLLLPDVLRSRFLPTVVMLFIVGLVIVVAKSLPARMERQEGVKWTLERHRIDERRRAFENVNPQGPNDEHVQGKPSGD